MKKFPLLALFLLVLSACKLDPVRDVWEYYEDWRNENNAWLAQQEARTNADGTPYYQKVVPEFDRNAYVLIHYFTDRSATEGNLSPLISSTVDVKYKLLTCRGVGVDSTYLLTSPADSVYRSVCQHHRFPNRVDGYERGRFVRGGDSLPAGLQQLWQRHDPALLASALFLETQGYI